MLGAKTLSKAICLIILTCLCIPAASAQPNPSAGQILQKTGVQGGVIVHIGCTDGLLTAALHANDRFLVQGLTFDIANVDTARSHIKSLNLYGPVTIDRLTGNRLPYVENFANLVVAEDLGPIPIAEVMRILCPQGVAYVKIDGKWAQTVKPRPKEIDDWTHYLHDASNNAVAHDSVIAPPRRLQWIGSPLHARHHDRMSSVSASVAAGGRIFYVMDEASAWSILVAPKWSLIARDAFNGAVLWKRQIETWHTHLWPLKSGPAQLPRRLVASGDRVYVTLGYDAPVSALDAATGKTVRTYPETAGAEELILSNGVLCVLANPAAKKNESEELKAIGKAYGARFWNEAPRKVVAVEADTGKQLWSTEQRVLPVTLAADSKKVVFHDGEKIVARNLRTGEELWQSENIARADVIKSFYAPTLVLYQDVVLFSGGETAGAQTGSWYMSGKDTMTALSAKTGKTLWTSYHPPSGYRSPEDLLVAGGLVWTGETTSGRAEGVFKGRDPWTGEVKSQFAPDVDVYWFHHRCYRGKATDKYLLMSRTGIEFLDIKNKTWTPHHWTRGACLYGIMPANGLIYNPPNPCACYLESKVDSFNALAPALKGPRITVAKNDKRLQKGPAYANVTAQQKNPGDWPTYRHDPARSGTTKVVISDKLANAWKTEIGGRITSPVIAEGKLLVASTDTHTVHALDADSGKNLWQYTAGARIDSPPTVHKGHVLFGSADGYIYALRASDGALAWRFRAAPMDQRLMAHEQIESVWPVHGSVLVKDDVLYCTAGRSMFLDEGLRVLRLDATTGRLLSETVLNDHDTLGKDLHEYVSWLNMPPALPDILSTDGKLIYMRSMPFNLDGKPLPLEKMPTAGNADAGAPAPTQNPELAHLFCPTGFLDDSYWHRTYWMYGSRFVSGWCGYYLAGKAAPAGKILVFDDSTVYGFGRKPQYFRWTTPIEHQLFSADKTTSQSPAPDNANTKDSYIQIANSKSLNPVGKPITVQAWVKPEKPNGVILARGGNIHGYALYIQNAKPCFAVRINEKLSVVKAKEGIDARWRRLAGVLTQDKKLQIYIDGKLAASAPAPGLLEKDPADTMQIAADVSSTVGDYTGPFPFKGLIDEVRVYHRALNADEIQDQSTSNGLVLNCTFDNRKATDSSPNKNNGTVTGADSAKGKVGLAMRFTGQSKSASGFGVEHNWTSDIPIIARAMVLANDTLFIAGPEDMIDEPEAFRLIDNPRTTEALAAQADAISGKRGAILMAVSKTDAATLATLRLDSPPVFDGMAAANGKLYISTMDGNIIAMKQEKQ